MIMTSVNTKTSAELLAAKGLAAEMKNELTNDILPYWMNKMCDSAGRFHGRISGMEELDASAPVGGIMTARILWTFASAYRVLGNPEYLKVALRAKNLIINKFNHKVDRIIGCRRNITKTFSYSFLNKQIIGLLLDFDKIWHFQNFIYSGITHSLVCAQLNRMYHKLNHLVKNLFVISREQKTFDC